MKWPKRRLELRDLGMALYLLSLALPAVRQEDHNWLHETLTEDMLPGWFAFILGLLSMVRYAQSHPSGPTQSESLGRPPRLLEDEPLAQAKSGQGCRGGTL